MLASVAPRWPRSSTYRDRRRVKVKHTIYRLAARHIVHPFELQVEAALRVMAIADQAGCPLKRGQGGVLDHTVGPMVRALMPWDRKPTGHPLPSERARFCGCPKPSSSG